MPTMPPSQKPELNSEKIITVQQHDLIKNNAQQIVSADTDQSEDITQEIGGPSGPEPTRYGDWEVNGRCSDF